MPLDSILTSEDAIAQAGPLVHARERGVLGAVQALGAQLVHGVQLVARLAAQLAAPRGKGVGELIIPPRASANSG